MFNLNWSLAEEFLGHWSLDYIWNSYVHFPLGILQKGISTKVWQSHDPLNNDLNRYQQFYNLFHRISVQKSRSLLVHCGQVFHARNHAVTQNFKMGPKFLRNYFWKKKCPFSNKIIKTQNHHLSKLDRFVVVNLKPIYQFLVFIPLGFWSGNYWS